MNSLYGKKFCISNQFPAPEDIDLHRSDGPGIIKCKSDSKKQEQGSGIGHTLWTLLSPVEERPEQERDPDKDQEEGDYGWPEGKRRPRDAYADNDQE